MVDTAGLALFRDGDEQTHLDAALKTVQSYCGWHLTPNQTDTVSVYAHRDTLLLPTMYLTAVVSVTQLSEVLDDTAVDFTTAGVVRRKDGWWSDCDLVTVEFDHGYDDLPEDLAQAIYAEASRSLKNPGSPTLTRLDIDQVISESYAASGTVVSQNALAPYRLLSV